MSMESWWICYRVSRLLIYNVCTLLTHYSIVQRYDMFYYMGAVFTQRNRSIGFYLGISNSILNWNGNEYLFAYAPREMYYMIVNW